jgi:hypothetical protein
MAASLSFDFNKAAEKIRHDFPQLKDALFVDSSNYDLAALELNKKFRTRNDMVHFQNKLAAAKSYQEASATRYFSPLDTLIYHPNVLQDTGIADKRDFIQAMAVEHETGHLLVPDAMGGPSSTLYKECAADSFAAIRHLQSLGPNPDTSDLESWIWMRAFRVAQGGHPDHVTITALNQIVEDSKTIDFSKLTPEETIQAAEKYARTYAPSEDDLEQSMSAYKGKSFKLYSGAPIGNIANIEKFISTALATSNSFVFQIGAQAFEPFLHPEGFTFKGIEIALPKEKREELRDALAEKAKEFKLFKLMEKILENKADIVQSQANRPEAEAALKSLPAQTVATVKKPSLSLA